MLGISPMPLKQTFGFLGAGRMATALAGGMVQSGLVKGRQLVASDVVSKTLKAFTNATGGKALKSNNDVLRKADVVIIAVKPHQITNLLSDLASEAKSHHLFISIAAGVTLEQLEESLGGKVRVIRVMPNTPVLVGEGPQGLPVALTPKLQMPSSPNKYWKQSAWQWRSPNG